MPTISPSVRPTIGGSTESVFPRATVKASTGMDLPPVAQTSTETMGQPVTTEETPDFALKAQDMPPAVRLSPQLTALARKEQKLQAEIQALRQKEVEWEKRQSDYVPKSSFREKVQKNAQEALSELGLSYDELTNLLLTQSQGADPVAQLRGEIEQLKQSQRDTVDKQYEATLKQYKAETESVLEASPREYALIRSQGQQQAVVDWIVDTFETEDRAISVEQAAREVEMYLREEAKKLANALKEVEPPEEKIARKLPPPQQALKTLTSTVETSPTKSYGQFQHLSPRERLAQAIARAQQG